MPIETVLVVCAVVAMFSAFSSAVVWANRQSALARAARSASAMQAAE